MQKSRLINTLRQFSRKELRTLKKWLDSPAHNQREDVKDLFQYLYEKDRLSQDEKLEKESVFAAIFPKEEYDDAKMRQVIHFMYKAVEQFMIYQEVEQDEIYSQLLLARAFRKKKLHKDFEKTIQLTQKKQKNYPLRNHTFHRNAYILEKEIYTYKIELQNIRMELNLQEASDATDNFFIVNKLMQAILMLIHQSVYQTNYDIGFLEEVCEIIQKKNLLKLPAIGIYYYVLQTIKDKEEESHFYNLKELISKYYTRFPLSEMADIYRAALNYCIGKYNSGGIEMKQKYAREAFELYKEGLSRRTFTIGESINNYTFLNVCSFAIFAKEYDWLENFINEYAPKLPIQYRETTPNYNRARLYFAKKEYEKSLDCLRHFEPDDLLTNLNARIIQIKIYYELSEFKALDSSLESMRAYLQRKKVMGYHKDNYKNFIKYTKKLLRVNPYSRVEKDKLHGEIKEARPIAEKEWLLRQVEEM